MPVSPPPSPGRKSSCTGSRGTLASWRNSWCPPRAFALNIPHTCPGLSPDLLVLLSASILTVLVLVIAKSLLSISALQLLRVRLLPRLLYEGPDGLQGPRNAKRFPAGVSIHKLLRASSRLFQTTRRPPLSSVLPPLPPLGNFSRPMLQSESYPYSCKQMILNYLASESMKNSGSSVRNR